MLRNSYRKFMAGIASAIAALMLLGAGSAAAATPTTWSQGSFWENVYSSPVDPVTVTVGNGPALVCPAAQGGAAFASNYGVPLQAHLNGSVGLNCGPGGAVAIGFKGVGFKSPLSLSFVGNGATPFRIATPSGTWDVAAPAYSGAWSNMTQTVTFAPGTPVGTTTVGGLPVTIAGTLRTAGPALTLLP